MGLTEQILEHLHPREYTALEKRLTSTDSQAGKWLSLYTEFAHDEEKLEARFKRAVPKGNMSVVKNAVQHAALNEVVRASLDHHPAAQVELLILQLREFSNRTAVTVVQKLLAKALEIAEEYELLTQWSELVDYEIYFGELHHLHTYEVFQQKLKQHELLLEKMSNHQQYRQLEFRQMRLTNANYMLRTEEAKAEWKAIADNPLLQSPERARSVSALLEYHILRAHCFFIFLEYEKQAQEALAIIALFEKHPFLTTYRNMHLLWAYTQLAHVGYYLKRNDWLEMALHQLKLVPKKSVLEEVAAFTYDAHYSMAYSDLKGFQDEMKKAALLAAEGLVKWNDKIKRDARVALLGSCVSALVEVGEYEKALDLIREHHDFLHLSNRLDSKVIIQFFELIAQIETGNELVVNETLQNFNRFLLRNQFKSEFEQRMMRFLKIISSGSPEMKEELALLQQQLKDIPKEALLSQHPILWQIILHMAESRIAGLRYHEYMAGLKQAAINTH
ncbi:MAG: hypothetical protein U0T84_04785 [Chitinophagales bacterium]